MKKLLFTLLLLFGASQAYSIPDGATETLKVGYIQLDVLLLELDMYNDMQQELNSTVIKLEREYTSKDELFQKELTDFNDNINKGVYTIKQAEQAQARLQQKENDLQQMKEILSLELEEQQMVMHRKVVGTVKKYVEKYSKAQGYSLVLTTTENEERIMYALPGMDITQDIISGLNEEYKQQK